MFTFLSFAVLQRRANWLHKVSTINVSELKLSSWSSKKRTGNGVLNHFREYFAGMRRLVAPLSSPLAKAFKVERPRLRRNAN